MDARVKPAHDDSLRPENAPADSRLNPNVVLRRAIAAFMAGVENPARLDQQEFDLVLGIRLVLNAFRNDEHLSRRHAGRAIAEVDPQNALQHDERLVRILMVVPDEVAAEPDDLELVVIHFGNDLRLPLLAKQGEFLGEIDCLVGHGTSPNGGTPSAAHHNISNARRMSTMPTTSRIQRRPLATVLAGTLFPYSCVINIEATTTGRAARAIAII